MTSNRVQFELDRWNDDVESGIVAAELRAVSTQVKAAASAKLNQAAADRGYPELVVDAVDVDGGELQ